MPPRIEKGTIKHLTEDTIVKDQVAETARKLEREFPGGIALLPQSSTIYHHSKKLSLLLRSGAFNPSFSGNLGAFFFTDLPIPSRTNCSVTIPTSLILIESSSINNEDITWDDLSKLGLDGRFVHDVGEPFARIAEDEYANSIAIFRTSLSKLGKISRYHSPVL